MEAILWILFVVACVLVSAVILLQEGKGGGLSEAFGGVGQQTFGVKAEGINKFTGWVSFVVILLAIVITRVRGEGELTFAPSTPPAAPALPDPGASDAGAPAGEPASEAPTGATGGGN